MGEELDHPPHVSGRCDREPEAASQPGGRRGIGPWEVRVHRDVLDPKGRFALPDPPREAHPGGNTVSRVRSRKAPTSRPGACQMFAQRRTPSVRPPPRWAGLPPEDSRHALQYLRRRLLEAGRQRQRAGHHVLQLGAGLGSLADARHRNGHARREHHSEAAGQVLNDAAEDGVERTREQRQRDRNGRDHPVCLRLAPTAATNGRPRTRRNQTTRNPRRSRASGREQPPSWPPASRQRETSRLRRQPVGRKPSLQHRVTSYHPQLGHFGPALTGRPACRWAGVVSGGL